MKKVSLVLLAILLAVTGVLAQTPNEFKYQAVLRNADGTIMAEESVAVDISILEGSASGTSVFDESHSVTTTAQGLINLNIGSVENMSSVDWSADIYFVEISVNSTLMGTSQLLSVPYAMYAETSGSSIPGPQGEQGIQGETGATGADGADGATGADGAGGVTQAGTNVTVTGAGTALSPYVINATSGSSTYTIGLNDDLGGYVFFVTPDGKHGLVAATQDQSISNNWYTAQDVISYPANHNIAGKNFTDWRLPTRYELNLMYDKKDDIGILTNYYWSSTEDDYNSAGMQDFSGGIQYANESKTNAYYLRAVRAF